MKIISEKTNKTYTNVEECLRDEAIFDKAQEEKTKKQKQLELAKKDRAKEVEKAYNDLIEAQKNYNNIVNYKGFVPSDKLISTAEGDFGLVWDGDSISLCSGELGEYLKFNNPHKTSLYIRCHLPIIIWSKAALAPFIKENKIGFCIDSLDQIDNLLLELRKEDYDEIRKNVIKISDKLSDGYYTTTALNKILNQKENYK